MRCRDNCDEGLVKFTLNTSLWHFIPLLVSPTPLPPARKSLTSERYIFHHGFVALYFILTISTLYLQPVLQFHTVKQCTWSYEHWKTAWNYGIILKKNAFLTKQYCRNWRACNFFAIWVRMLISFLIDVDIGCSL